MDTGRRPRGAMSVDPPHRQLDPGGFQGFAPGQHVLVDAVHERAIEIKEKCAVPRSGHGNDTPNNVYLVYYVYLVLFVYTVPFAFRCG